METVDMHQESREALLKRASWIAIVGNSILALLKLGAGYFGNSLAVLSDGIDSSTDVVISLMTLYAAVVAAKPSDRKHPYGHGRAETVATTVLSFVIFFAGAQLLWGAVSGLIKNTQHEMPSTFALLATGISVVGKLILASTQRHYGKRANSPMLLANAKNMQMDILTSVSILVGLGITFLLGIPMLDRVLAALVALWIIKNAYEIFKDANTELMDGGAEHQLYVAVFAAVASVPGAMNPHRCRIRRLGSNVMIDLDIEVKAEMTVKEAHRIATAVEQAIKRDLQSVYDVVVHVEPEGAGAHDERFGLSADNH
ncbi:MAG TPA: cation diffusion facilitator family transporter [Myxococcota bacterium]|nr:cation diffusion facilitator family transporter [Myxococcota bacterium]